MAAPGRAVIWPDTPGCGGECVVSSIEAAVVRLTLKAGCEFGQLLHMPGERKQWLSQNPKETAVGTPN